MTWETTKFIAAILGELGGIAVLIAGLSKYLGKLWASKIIEAEKARHKKELEVYKTQLEISKLNLNRYMESQFNIYFSLWKSLVSAKKSGDALMKCASQQLLFQFSDDVAMVERSMYDNLPLLENEHFLELRQLLRRFWVFEIGKAKLIDLRRDSHIPHHEIQEAIKMNEHFFSEYNSLLLQIADSYRVKLKGFQEVFSIPGDQSEDTQQNGEA